MTGIQCRHCSEPADHMQGRNTWLCDRHYRYVVMRASATRHGKSAPSFEQLDDMVPYDMRCPMCGTPMVWLGADNPKAVISLRHFSAHQIKLVCRSCSTRATFAPDEFMLHNPSTEKHCPKCGQWKPLSGFYVSKRGFRGDCIACEKIRRDRAAALKTAKPRTEVRGFAGKEPKRRPRPKTEQSL